MTLRKSYSKLLVTSLKNHMWSIALTCIGLFLTLPIYSALNVSIIRNGFASGMYKQEVLARLFSRNVFGEVNYLLMMAIFVLAIIIAINGFSYLFFKEKVDLYHSIPVKREELFAINYLAGIITFAIPYLVFLLITVLIAGANSLLVAEGIKALFIMLLVNFIRFLFIYSVTVLAIMLTGNVMVSILATGVFMLYGVLVKALFNICNDAFFFTFSYYSEEYGKFNSFSPFITFIKLTDGMDTFHGRFDISILQLCVVFIITLILTGLNVWLYIRRPSEAAGKSIAFRKTMPVISCMLLIPISLSGGLLFESLANNNGSVNYMWLFFGTAFVMFIAHLVIQAIYFRDFKSLFKNLLNPVISGVVVVIVLCVYIFDITGYDNYNPCDKNNYESAAIASYAVQDYQQYYDFDVDADEYGNKNYWIDTMVYKLDHVDIKDSELVKELVNVAISDSRRYEEINKAGVDYDEVFEGTSFAEFTVKFKFKNGKTVFRQYNIDLKAHMDLFNKLYTNEDYKKGVFEILTVDDEKLTNIKFANQAGTVNAQLTKEQMINIVNAYRQEILSQNAYELVNTAPIGYIFEERIINENGYQNNYFVYKSYIYPSFTKTIALLKEYGVDVNKYIDLDNIESICISNYHYNDENYIGDGMGMAKEAYDLGYAQDSENADIVEYTDPEDIRKIYEVISPSEFSDVDYIFKDRATLDVQVRYKELPNNYYGNTISYCICKGDVPDFVATDVNYHGN